MTITLYNTPQGIFLRQLQLEDAHALLDLRIKNREAHAIYEPIREESFFTLDGQQKFLQQRLDDATADRGCLFGLFDLKEERLIGQVNISNIVRGVAQYADIGYFINQDDAGKGHMTAALKLIVQYGFKALRLHRLQACTLLHNEASQRVLLKAGFQSEGNSRRYLKIHGEWQDHRRFAVMVDDELDYLQG